MTRACRAILVAFLAFFQSVPALSQTPWADPAAVAASPFSYADIADLVTRAPLVIDARIRKATPLPPERAPGIGPGEARFYVEGEVLALIRGAEPLARRIAWLVDLPRDERGRPAKPGKVRVLLFARAVDTGQVALVAPGAQLGWDAATEALTRRIITEAVRPDAPARITGVARGFHQPGTLPGESESQFFVETDSGAPVTLLVRRAPGAAPRWAVAFGEIVDGAATVPARGTLGWYRLACGLPRSLAAGRIVANDVGELATAFADYAIILGELGECRRTRPPPPAPVSAAPGPD